MRLLARLAAALTMMAAEGAPMPAAVANEVVSRGSSTTSWPTRVSRPAWGFAAMVATPNAAVLFDTGSDGAVLREYAEATPHLVSAAPGEVDAVVGTFRALGVRRVASSHCTGDAARRRFADVYGPDYIAGGAGRVLRFEAARDSRP
ncbi:MAG: hypothetical protein C3F17_19730 [Bradyrhizobiaceae bacterium]|nr:MAG: hypothetical protein C3F17_19730 [Bradyrhizobiaceae bacterium]